MQHYSGMHLSCIKLGNSLLVTAQSCSAAAASGRNKSAGAPTYLAPKGLRREVLGSSWFLAKKDLIWQNRT